MSEQQTIADRYRREAIELRRAAEVVQDERFRDQLLSIANDLDAWAAAIEAGDDHGCPVIPNRQ
jgi:predicted nucleic acid-binding Zn ribbon protein